MPHVPEPEALQQHADAFTPFRNAVQPSVEVEVLERCQLAVDERLVREVPDASALERDLELAGSRNRKPGAKPEERRLSGSVRSGDDQEAVSRKVEPDAAQNALVAVALLQSPSPNHQATVVALSQPERNTAPRPFQTRRGVTRRGLSPTWESRTWPRSAPWDMEFAPKL